MSSQFELQVRLHEKRSEFCEELRRLRMAASLTQAALVAQVDSGLTLNAYKKWEWRGGDTLPDVDRVADLAEALGEEAKTLIDLRAEVETLRIALRNVDGSTGSSGGFVERFIPWPDYTARDLFRRTIHAIEANCVAMTTSHGKVIGWRQFLENDQLEVTPMSSAYGLFLLLWAGHASAAPSIGQIRDSILLMEKEGGGWGARTQNRLARVEAYGPTLHAPRLSGLSDAELQSRVEHYEHILDRSTDPATWQFTAILTVALDTLSSVHPESERIPELLAALREAAIEDGEFVYWTESLVDGRRQQLKGSVPLTARAVVAIAGAPDELTVGFEDLVERAVRWLETHVYYVNERETIERQNEADPEFLIMRHFTAAWVALALAGASKWTRPDLDKLRLAEDKVLQQVREDGLWHWHSGELPIWMTYDGVRALEAVARTIYDLTRT